MSGETEQQVSGWTVDTLKTYLERVISESDRRYEARHEADERHMDRTTLAMEKRLDGMNEFRQQLSEQANTFLPRHEYDRAHIDLAGKVESTARELHAKMDTAVAGLEARVAALQLQISSLESIVKS
jgi:hypothetical protein